MTPEQLQRYQTLATALHIIKEFGGASIDTENGPLACNGGWCADQARAALEHVTETLKTERADKP